MPMKVCQEARSCCLASSCLSLARQQLCAAHRNNSLELYECVRMRVGATAVGCWLSVGVAFVEE